MQEWEQVLLKQTDTMSKAIEVLDNVGLRIILIVDEHGKLLGTITDGDIRRALIRRVGMNSDVSQVMYRKPTVASVDDNRSTILSMMKQRDLLQVPILNHDGVVVGLESLHHLIDGRTYDNPIFLMAGGFGRRLGDLTTNTPKPLLKVGNKPILETILEQFIELGFHNIFISTHYKAEMLHKHFGNGGEWGVNISYVHEDKPLGTAGALGLLAANIPDLPVIMMNGDILTKVNFERLLNFHREQGGIATMCVREYDLQVPYGVVQAEELQVKCIVEKPVHKFFVNAGIYVLEPELVKSVDGTSYLDMPNLLEQRIEQGEQISMFPMHEYWLDIGQKEEYEKAQDDIAVVLN